MIMIQEFDSNPKNTMVTVHLWSFSQTFILRGASGFDRPPHNCFKDLYHHTKPVHD